GFFVFKLPKRERQPVPPPLKIVPPAKPAAPKPEQPAPPVTLRAITKRSKKSPRATPSVMPVPLAPSADPTSRRTVFGLIAVALLTLILIAVVIVIGSPVPDISTRPAATDASSATRVPALELL